MVDIWVVSDTHFGHENIIKYCNRPFSHAREMNEILIHRWNEVVKPKDHVYHFGDVVFCHKDRNQEMLDEVMPRLNGHKRLVLGNHDNVLPMISYAEYFEKILVWRLFNEGGQTPLILTHVPIHESSFGKAQVNVHGHIHDNPSPRGPYINACVEKTNYTPVHLDDYIARASRWVKAMETIAP